MTLKPAYRNRYFNSLVLFVVFAMTLIYQTRIIKFDTAYLMVFTSGSIGLILLQCFYKRPILRYTVPMFLFLLMLLFTNMNVYIYLGLALLLTITSFGMILYSGDTSLTWFYAISIILVVGISIIAHINLLPLIAPIYFGCCIVTSNLDRKHVWSYAVVVLLSVATVIATITDSIFIEIRYTIFSIPISLLIFLFVVKGRTLLSNTYRIIESEVLLTTTVSFILYVFAYASVINTLGSYLFLIVIGCFMTIISIVFYAWTKRVFRISTMNTHAVLEPWFISQWEDALAEQSQSFSWRGFNTVFNDVLSNDGILISINNHEVFRSGFAQEALPEHTLTLNAHNTAITLHKRRNYQNYSLRDMITNTVVVEYLSEQNIRWQQVKKISVSNHAAPALNQDLTLRKEITYYLHDNILQNIIATKNIVSMLDSEQVALQDLAVNTLSDLNDSIRSQIHEIYPSSLNDLPFERNIHILIDELRKKYFDIPALNINYEIYDKMDAESAYVFYRALQEFLNNTCKYAEADSLSISMQTINGTWQLCYSDDGIPLDLDTESKIKHLGLSSLQQQVQALHGTFTINTDHKQFIITLPRRPHENTTI
ncbi:hypothetical protein G7062_10915 [Erysipelothrix sp. HDW6C]|uniref:sensor histidine kinase n=1 Tax=Erysipelothrix sp. HDW6C TaxID=2714930 RepID=UPI00140C7C15|nr:hypothetical protein [Erysipelothrix sp. HDW6C]QIK70774.1 hypothetical protein G7062_10915 [Erysipelothrix sp. HDW6C]